MIRLRLLAVAVLATSLLTAAPAYADFDPVPLACHAQISPWEGRVVFSAYNPNATTTYVDYGNDNIVLESPNFVEGQPTEFAPGLGEGLFLGRYDHTYPGPGHRTWYLSGTIANARDGACGGDDGPVNTVPPHLTGDPVAGEAIVVDPGTWTGGGPGGVWQTALLESCGDEGCRLVGGSPYLDVDSSSTPISFSVPGHETGRRLRAVVATYSWRGVTLAASALSDPVVGSTAPNAPDPQVVDGAGRDNQTPVVLGGTAIPPPSRLNWLGFPAPTLSFAWQRCTNGDCAAIAGADERTYRLAADDVGHSLRVRVTGTNASGSASSTSQTVAIDATMPSGPSAAVAVETPTLAGTPQVGAALAARPGSWLTTEAFRYQWQRCASACEDIGGADGASYVATAADAGARLRAVVLATGAAGTRTNQSAVTRFSTEPSEPVAAAPETPVTPVTHVTPPPPAGVTPTPAAPTIDDEVAPRISAVKLSRWRASRGTILRFTLSEAASLRIDVRRPPRSRSWVTLRRTVAKGSHQVRIAGRVEQRRLRPGRYTLTVLATDASGNRSSPVTRRFTVPR